MSFDWVADVIDFHEKMGLNDVSTSPRAPSYSVSLLKQGLVREEFQELMVATHSGDLVGIADACADLIYVVIGLALAYGIDLRPIWDEVHRANMAKVGGPIRGDGKQMKPDGWTSPDIAGILSKQHRSIDKLG